MVLTKLKVVTLKVHITVFAMVMVLMQIKHERIESGFTQQNMVFLMIEERSNKVLHQTTLYNG